MKSASFWVVTRCISVELRSVATQKTARFAVVRTSNRAVHVYSFTWDSMSWSFRKHITRDIYWKDIQNDSKLLSAFP
jgi:hypothetical protein